MVEQRRKGDMSKNWLELIGKFGVPAALACYLVYTLAEKVDVKLDALVSSMSSHAAIGEHQSKALDRLILINQQTCIAQAKIAKTDEQRCWK